MKDNIDCPICKRDIPPEYQEKHHITPKCKKGKVKVPVCCTCGDMVHKLFTNKELEKQYNSIEKISEHPDVVKWVNWVSKKPYDFSVCMATKKRRR